MPRKALLKRVKRIVVKVGTSSISHRGKISTKKITGLVQDVVTLIEKGYQVVIVSSGAIAAGANSLGKDRNSLTIPEKQALASVGQAILINEYRKLFSRHGYNVGQILLTEDDVKHRRRFLNARNTLDKLIDLKVVPVVNENDSVVVKEIKFGDNDTLSAHVASLIDADLLILLSDVDGFYWNPDDPAPAEEITKITGEVLERCGGAGTEFGTGGMTTKIRAADIIIRFGEMMIIAGSGQERVLQRIMEGEKIGTLFHGNVKPLSSRKKWLALRSVNGTVVLDQGAVEAVVHKKKSLLASGIVRVSGNFDMGDVVEITDQDNRAIGKGVVNYNHMELQKIKGLKTVEIEKILGGKFFDEVVHRDDMIVY